MGYTAEALAWFGAGDQARDEVAAAAQNGLEDAWGAAVINTTGGLNDRTRIVRISEVSYHDAQTATAKLVDALQWFVTAPEVKTHMEESKADAAYLLVGIYFDFGGIADYRKGFAVSPVLHGAFPMVHELGHALPGFDHDPLHRVAPGGTPTWVADHYVDGVGRGLMSYADEQMCPRGCPPEFVFANPDAFYPGTAIPSCIRGERENARMLIEARSKISLVRVSGNECVVAAFAP